ncbi:cadherin-like domain-containing protein [Roseobacteraceae bacterium S113]
MTFSTIRTFDGFTLDFDGLGDIELFSDAQAEEFRFSFTNFFDPSFTFFDTPPGDGLISGKLTGIVDGGLVFSSSSAGNTGSLDYLIGAQFAGDVLREDGTGITYSFLPTQSTARFDAQIFQSDFEADLYFDAGVSYEDLQINLPWILGGGALELGTGDISISDAVGEVRYNIYDSGTVAPNGSVSQTVIVDGLVDLIANRLDPKVVSVDIDTRGLYRSIQENNGNGQTIADAFAPTIRKTFSSGPLLDGQLDLDAIVQTLTAAGAASLFGGTNAAIEYIELNGFIDELEIDVLEVLTGLKYAGPAREAVSEQLSKIPFLPNGEIVIFDATANLGLELLQDVVFDPTVTYTVTVGSLSRTAELHEALSFTDAELDVLAEGEKPTIAFDISGSFESTYRLAPVASITAAAGVAKFKIQMPSFSPSKFFTGDRSFNFDTNPPLWSQQWPEGGLKLGEGLTLGTQSTPIAISIDAAELNYGVYQPTVTEVVIIPQGDPLQVRTGNLTVVGTANSDEITHDPTISFGPDDAIIMNGAGGDDIIGDANGSQNVTKIGGAGNDRISGDGTFIDAGADNDTVEAGIDSSRPDVDLGTGDDYVFTTNGGGALFNSILAGEGNDLIQDVGAITFFNEPDIFSIDGLLDLGAGNDTLEGGGGMIIELGDGDDLVIRSALEYPQLGYSLNGGEGNDTVEVLVLDNGVAGKFISGGDDNDILTARGEIFTSRLPDQTYINIYGGSGHDALEAIQIGAQLEGGTGNDNLTARTFSKLYGDDGNDVLLLTENIWNEFLRSDYTDAVARGSLSELYGGTGDDDIRITLADSGLARLRAGVLVEAGLGDDRIQDHFFKAYDSVARRDFIAESNDLFRGGAGNDVIVAGAGADTINGGTGNDILAKLAGETTMVGGKGDDVLILGSNAGLTPDNFSSSTSLYENRGGIITGSANGSNGRDTLVVDLTAIFRVQPEFTQGGNVVGGVRDYLYAGELDTKQRVAPDALNVVFTSATSGTLQYLDTGGAVIGSLNFSGIEHFVFNGMAEEGDFRFIARQNIHFDFSALGATLVEEDITSSETVESRFDPNFGISGALGERASLLLSGKLEVWQDQLLLPIDIQFTDFVLNDFSETSSPLHPLTQTTDTYDLLTTSPGPRINPADITPENSDDGAGGGPSPTAPSLGQASAQVSVLANTAVALDASFFPLTDSDTDADELFYRVLSTPNIGFLARDTELLDRTEIFTHQDVLDGLIFFVHTTASRDTAAQVELEVFDVDGQLATGGTDGTFTLDIAVDVTEAVNGTLSIEDAGIASDGSFGTEIILTTDAPVVGMHFLELAFSGPGAAAFEGDTYYIFINHGETEARMTLYPDVAVDVATGALTITVATASLGLNVDAFNTLVVDTIAGVSGTPSAGNDTVIGSEGNDEIDGLAGNDVIEGGGGNDTLAGGSGRDRLEGGNGADEIDGGGQFDTIVAGSGDDVVTGGFGADVAHLDGGNDLFTDNDQGTEFGMDTVHGGAGNDRILGGGGSDSFFGDGGKDWIEGGLGDDLIDGGFGADTLIGGEGNDSVLAGSGNDIAQLGAGNDSFSDTDQSGLYGRDTVYGGSGNDLIEGIAGADVYYGEDGKDRLVGGRDNDTLDGGLRSDTINAGDGDDLVYGGFGRDLIDLGAGADRFVDTDQGSPYGDDTITGGAGADQFVFGILIANEVITDFELGLDRLEINSVLSAGQNAATVAAAASVTGQGVLLDFGSGQSILLEGLSTKVGLDTSIDIF